MVSRWKNYFFFAGDLEAGFAAGAAAGFAAGFFVAAKDCSSDYRSVASMGCAVPEPMGCEAGRARLVSRDLCNAFPPCAVAVRGPARAFISAAPR